MKILETKIDFGNWEGLEAHIDLQIGIPSQCYRNLRQMANFTAKLDFRKCFNNGLVALTRAFTLKLKLLFLASYCSSSYKKT